MRTMKYTRHWVIALSLFLLSGTAAYASPSLWSDIEPTFTACNFFEAHTLFLKFNSDHKLYDMRELPPMRCITYGVESRAVKTGHYKVTFCDQNKKPIFSKRFSLTPDMMAQMKCDSMGCKFF